MPGRVWFERFPKLCLAALALGSAAGCFIPGGGWTLRTGLDWRTHAKPGAYLEMVDTRWDEWNRVAQMNAMMGSVESVSPVVHPVPAASLPPAQPPVQEPYPIPPAAGISGALESPPRLETNLQGNKTIRPAGKLQMAERRSTKPTAPSDEKRLDSATERDLVEDRITQSSWRPADVAKPSVTAALSPGKAPPGGWLFRGVRHK